MVMVLLGDYSTQGSKQQQQKTTGSYLRMNISTEIVSTTQVKVHGSTLLI